MKEQCRKFGRMLIAAVPWLVWAVLTAVMLVNAGKLQNIYPGISLRYSEPIQSDAAFSARRFFAQNADAAACWPTYWSQTKEVLQSDYAQQESLCLWYAGDGGLVYPARFIAGGWPGELSEKELCVSTRLAWALWGSLDVRGLAVCIGEERYTVGGVFEDKESLVLASSGSATPAQGWQGVELTGSLPDDSGEFVQNYTAASGLGTPETLLDGRLIRNLSMFLAVLPTVILLVFILASLFKSTPGAQNGRRGILLFALALLFAFLLPALLDILPEMMIPGKWSDVGFWSALIQRKLDDIKQWLLMRPFIMDYRAKLLLIFQAFLASLAITNTIVAGIRITCKHTADAGLVGVSVGPVFPKSLRPSGALRR